MVILLKLNERLSHNSKILFRICHYFKEINVSRATNCKVTKRTGHKELLISNFKETQLVNTNLETVALLVGNKETKKENIPAGVAAQVNEVRT